MLAEVKAMQRLGSSYGARIHTSRSSSVVRITFIALGWDRLDKLAADPALGLTLI
jgi:hypothetical protein